MHECEGMATITVEIRIPKVRSQFNSNYRSGIEVVEDAAVEELLTVIPKEWGVEVKDVVISDYQHSSQEREVEHD